MAETTAQTYLTKILTNRINSEKTAGTISADTDIASILDIFVASEKITLDNYTTLTNLISSSTTTTS